MHTSALPTRDPEAAERFNQGRERFRRYLGGGGDDDDLWQAEKSFAAAEQNDPGFRLASFFQAVTLNELRDSDRAIEKLRSLTSEGLDFLPEVYVQLAYAHTKRYEGEDYRRAEEALDHAAQAAAAAKREDLRPLIDSYRAFLYAVIGGRGEKEKRDSYLNQAIELGEALLRGRQSAGSFEFSDLETEVHNSLGIAYMRKGERAEPDSELQRQWWARAQAEYEAGLRRGWATARLLQNYGTLLRLQGDQEWWLGRLDRARGYYRKAIELYVRCREINPWDGFSDYRLAELHAKQGDWKAAREYERTGRGKMSSVKESGWGRVAAAVTAEDVAALYEPLNRERAQPASQ